MTSTENEPADPDAVARDALRLIGPDPQNWVPDRAGIDHNVMVVGGGQTGSAFSYALRRAGIGKVSVIDAAEDETRAGVWLNAARMNLLRTPKSLTGPELGTPAFGFQSWFEARHGRAAYAAIDRIPRTDWADYLTLVPSVPRDHDPLWHQAAADRACGWAFPAAPRHRRPDQGRDDAEDHPLHRLHRERRTVRAIRGE